MKPYLIFLLLIFLAQTACTSKTQSITDFDGELSENEVLIDVRTPEEYSKGYIEKAVNIDVKSDDFVEKVEQIDKNKNVYLYCQSGGRSLKASKILDSLGFKHVYNLDGGFTAWKEAGRDYVEE
ncbi:rhodanese-like domain-containing protein [Galbibacter sp. EGI 63066]|uniref:rhodanese-like domain-containing protein n=1 Tax=Galbibacter sp. EGI 63066 TaxID=2993559 RepID=UPI002249A1B1|nr:rhodanese-like domain-containing protein [Galbibacter sp. EGI 63066]MCX2680409.1 rhodanese-like domain-containing protein [Galbibacter sp. EGI 63066]